ANSDFPVSLVVFNRMALYARRLRDMKAQGCVTVSSVALADALSLNPSLVKKDISCAIVNEGKPKVGYNIDELIEDIENFLGYNNTKDAVLAGVGKLGQALMGYQGFEKYGLNIIAGFDVDERLISQEINGKKILPLDKLASAVKKLDIKIAILTTPNEQAQAVTDILVNAGIRAIWNFTPAHIKTPDDVAVKNEDMAVSLAVLSQQLKEILKKEST
ncbi:MAG: redox-sensing transcriptional repressor Rex, partial [Treponema sp.]|nr:redox-sensing transcriptional repressor Rex [Treponema sp.]